MAAVRYQGPCAQRVLVLPAAPAAEAPAQGRSTPCTQSGGHAGDPCAAQLGLDYIWREGACGPPCGSTCCEARALQG